MQLDAEESSPSRSPVQGEIIPKCQPTSVRRTSDLGPADHMPLQSDRLNPLDRLEEQQPEAYMASDSTKFEAL